MKMYFKKAYLGQVILQYSQRHSVINHW